MLCNLCHSLLTQTSFTQPLESGRLPQKTVVRRPLDAAALDFAATIECCHVCRAIDRALSRSPQVFQGIPESDRKLFFEIRHGSRPSTDNGKLFVRAVKEPAQGHQQLAIAKEDWLARFEIELATGESLAGGLISSLQQGSAKGSDYTGGESSFHFIRDSINECNEEHDDCREFWDSTWFPTRLIDLGGQDRPGIDQARLIITADNIPKGRYTSLSHSWGRAKGLKLGQDSLESFQRSIPISDLPRTFKDAFTVTRYIGIRYIWIDSLCIIQDSPADWQREAESMANVYQHSYLNIAASFSKDSDGGLFTHRDTRLSTPATITLHNPPFHGAYTLADAYLFHHLVDTAHLSSRAWVLQERILSPRILHFTSSLLFYDCHWTLASELFPQWHSDNSSDFAHTHSIKSKHTDLMHASIDKSLPALAAQWNRIVHAYSRTNISVPHDRPIAIYGVASAIAQSFPALGHYCAGLWAADIVSQLPWRVAVSARRLLHPDVPSWSWLSIDGAVDTAPPDKDSRSLAAITRVAHSCPSSEPFRYSLLVRLYLQCTLLAVRPVLHDDDEVWSLCAEHGTTIRGFKPDVSGWVAPERVYLFAVRRTQGSVEGLVVVPNSTTADTYSRCGMFVVLEEDFVEAGESMSVCLV